MALVLVYADIQYGTNPHNLPEHMDWHLHQPSLVVPQYQYAQIYWHIPKLFLHAVKTQKVQYAIQSTKMCAYCLIKKHWYWVYMEHIPMLEDWSWDHFSTVVAQLQYIPHCKQSSGLSDPSAEWIKITIKAPLATKNMHVHHVHHVPHTEHMESSIGSRRRQAVLCLSCSWDSERNKYA